ncbi:MAG: DUF2807 domain-containing protein [Sandarakinorhabdus sp.]|nr:DUF2807 domain-containing protein [Sandarakinorhabdus sp.]
MPARRPLPPSPLLGVLAAALLAVPGAAAERRFELTGFSRVVVETSDIVTIRKGDFAVSASGEADDLDRLEIRQSGDQLRIKRKPGRWWSRGRPLAITISLPVLTDVGQSGSGKVTADVASGKSVSLGISGSGALAVEQVAAEALRVSISGSGNVAAASVKAGTVAAAISGSGNVAMAGSCRQIDVRVSGSGDVDAARLACTNAIVAISGSGDVGLRATDAAQIGISGSGDVTVAGGARCTTRASGSGTVRCG